MQVRSIVATAGALLGCAVAGAQGGARDARQLPGAFFAELQEADALTADQMAARRAQMGDDSERSAADRALNDWKLCVTDAVSRWAELRPGPGTVADAAFGRCQGFARDYRAHLVRLTNDGRAVIDAQTARTMVRNLEESWRPRVIAAVLDQELAARRAAPAMPVAPGEARAQGEAR